MAIIKTDRAPIETVKRMLEDGMAYKDIAKYTRTSISEISVIARVLGLRDRKNGPKPGPKLGSKRKPKVS